MVFVIESAATNRSFRRFLGTPVKHFRIKLETHAFPGLAASLSRWCTLTLSKGLEHVPSNPCQAVLRCVSRSGPSRGGAYGHGHGAARTVTGGGMRGASGLGLKHKNTSESYSIISEKCNL